MKSKKILYVGTEFETNLEGKGKSLNFNGWYLNFKVLKHNVQKVTFTSNSDQSIDKKLLIKVKNFNPEIIFFVLQKSQVSQKTLKLLKDKAYLINFFQDDNWRFYSHTNIYAKYFDLCLTNDVFSIEKYNKLNIENIIHIQWASLRPKISNHPKKYKYDVSFIGAYSSYRNWLVKVLAKKGVYVDCFGVGWKNGNIDYTQFEEIIRESRINLNLPNSISYDIRYLFKNPKSLMSNMKNFILKKGKNSSEIKARIFEITAMKGFLLTDYVPSIELYFDLKNDITCFSSVDELYNLIVYYLENKDERERKRINGFNNSINNHLFEHRIKKIMDHYESTFKNH